MNDGAALRTADIGTVHDQFFTLRDFRLVNGAVLPEATIVYETYGRLAPPNGPNGGRNAVLRAVQLREKALKRGQSRKKADHAFAARVATAQRRLPAITRCAAPGYVPNAQPFSILRFTLPIRQRPNY